MAYVRKTDTLVYGIKNTVEQMQYKAQEPYEEGPLEQGSPAHKELCRAMMQAAWKLAPDLKSAMPPAWCSRTERADLHIAMPNGPKERVRMNSPANAEFHWPPNFSSYIPDVKIDYSQLGDDATAWFDKRDERKAKHTEIRDKYVAIRDKLEAFMGQHASLNSALTAMPELELYVPDEFMMKIRAKSPPRASKIAAPSVAEELDIDVNELTSLGVAHRISTAAE